MIAVRPALADGRSPYEDGRADDRMVVALHDRGYSPDWLPPSMRIVRTAMVSRRGAGDVDHFDHVAGGRADDARRTGMPVFVTVDDHATAQIERRDENDGEQQCLFHGSSSRI